MKRVVILAAAVALMAAMVSGVALAKGGGKAKGHANRPEKVATYVFEGTVAQVGDGSLVVNVEQGNRAARSFAGQQVSFTVTDATKISKDDADASLSDLSPGDEVVVQSKAAPGATQFTARIVSAHTPETNGGETTDATTSGTVQAD